MGDCRGLQMQSMAQSLLGRERVQLLQLQADIGPQQVIQKSA